MAAKVESGVQNLNHGDRDSLGLFQMRSSIWNKGEYAGYANDPEKQIDWFLDQAVKANRGKSLGEWAANIERPAEQFRGRYGQQQKYAEQLLAGLNLPAYQGSTDTSQTGVSATQISTAQTTMPQTAAAFRLSEARNNVMASLMAGGDPRVGLTDALSAMANYSTTPTKVEQSVPNTVQQGGVPLPPSAQADPVVVAAGGTGEGSQAVQLASKYIGTPYVWGGEQPGGFDCSGLLQYTYGKMGIQIPRVSQDQWRQLPPVQGDLQPGDLVFFKTKSGNADAPGHVGMYVGNNKYIEAPYTGAKVRYTEMGKRDDYIGARRPARK
jgi:cell wall-associated NlpC family hydrolase